MEQETLREIVAENRSLEEQLTKRNEQYIFDLKKSLIAANLSEEMQAKVLHEMLPNLIEGQKTGKTARQLYGTVSERTMEIIEMPEQMKESPQWHVWLDNALLLLAILTIMTGIMGIFSSKNNATFGVITILVTSIAGGFFLVIMNKYIYQYDRPGADKSKKPKFWKSAGILFLGALGWIIIMSVTMALPTKININLDPVVNVIIGLLALGARYLLKKKLNIQGGAFMR